MLGKTKRKNQEKRWILGTLSGLVVLTSGFGVGLTGGMVNQKEVRAEASSSKKYVKTNLNLRTGASIHHKRILVMPKGASVKVVGKRGAWSKVQYGKRTGYAYSYCLSNTKKSYKKAKTASIKSSYSRGYNGYYKKVMDVEVTAYTFNYGSNITASGKRLAVGDVAAPREIPFGSIVDIPSIERKIGKSTLKVYDRGGAIKRLSGNKIRIDVAFPSYSSAIQFGRKTYHNVPIYIKK